jgi:glycosyltransferase involved in cell wall biosynthesis
MSDPIVSIIIPCFNHGQFIDDAIKSVENSIYEKYEIIIINDGSSDNYTNSKLKNLEKSGYNILSQVNQGLGKTRNNGIRIAKGKYILPLDADNKIKPEFIKKAISVLENNPKNSIVYSDRQLFGNSNELIKVGEFNLSKLINENYIDACAIYRKNIWNEIGGYDENLPIQAGEDWDFWLSAAERGYLFHYIPEPLFYYRVLENSMIQQFYNNPNKESLFEYIYKKHCKLLTLEYKKQYNELKKLNLETDHPFKTSLKYMYKRIFRF